MTVKYQVFISSTFNDLKEERKQITEAVLDLDQIPSGMELFPAADEDQFDYISKVIDECDYYVLVVGGRYGSVAADGLSYTEKEFDYAKARGKTILAFLHKDINTRLASQVEKDAATIEKLDAFRKKAETGRIVKYWSDKVDLRNLVTASIALAMTRYPGVGWVRGDAAASATILQQLNEVRIENEQLKLKVVEDTSKIDLANIADLDEQFAINFMCKVRYSDPKFIRFITKTWLEVFQVVAPHFLTPTSSSSLKGILHKDIDPSNNYFEMCVTDETLTRVKLQLDALGLVNLFVADNISGGMGEFMQITNKGKALLYDTFVTRSAKTDL